MQSRNKRKFDYCRKDYSNPFFRKRGGFFAFDASWKSRFFIIILFLSVIGLGWLVFFSSIFKIKNIKISGLEMASALEIENLAWAQTADKKFFIGQRSNLFLFSESDFMNALKQKYYFESVQLDKRLPNAIVINIKEKIPKAVWSEDGKAYYMDEQGMIISEIKTIPAGSNAYLTVENRGGAKIAGRQADMDKEKLDFIIKADEELKNKKFSFALDRFIIDQDVNTVKIILVNAPMVFLNTKAQAADQINKLIVLYKDELKSEFAKKSYIDLRYGDMIYYR